MEMGWHNQPIVFCCVVLCCVVLCCVVLCCAVLCYVVLSCLEANGEEKKSSPDIRVHIPIAFGSIGGDGEGVNYTSYMPLVESGLGLSSLV